MNANRLVQVLTLSGLIAMMPSMGLEVTLHEVLASTRSLRLMFLRILANFALIPALVAFGLFSPQTE